MSFAVQTYRADTCTLDTWRCPASVDVAKCDADAAACFKRLGCSLYATGPTECLPLSDDERVDRGLDRLRKRLAHLQDLPARPNVEGEAASLRERLALLQDLPARPNVEGEAASLRERLALLTDLPARPNVKGEAVSLSQRLARLKESAPAMLAQSPTTQWEAFCARNGAHVFTDAAACGRGERGSCPPFAEAHDLTFRAMGRCLDGFDADRLLALQTAARTPRR